ICLKIIPVLLLIVPLWSRDGRCLLGCAVGLLLGLFVLPAAVIGPARAIDCSRQLYEVLLAPAVGVGSDQSRSQELTSVTQTDSESFQATLHNTLYLGRLDRPREASRAVRLTHWALALTMFLLTLATLGRRSSRDPVEQARRTTLLVGSLILNMILSS